MSIKLLYPLAILVLPASAFAQAGPSSIKSAEQITCELIGECAPIAGQELAQRDRGEERGFKLKLRDASGANSTPVGIPSANLAKGGASKSAGRGYTSEVPRSAARSASRTIPARMDMAKPRKSNLSVGFVTGSATLDVAGLAQANQLLMSLRNLVGRRVIVGGHTDNVGNRDYNLDLSQRRAQALVNYLVQNGIDRTKLSAKGFGFDQPLEGFSAKAGANRRVEITLAE